MVSVAVDIQGADVVRPYVKKAGVTYTALVDENNVLGELFRVNYVPLHYIIENLDVLTRPPDVEELLEVWKRIPE